MKRVGRPGLGLFKTARPRAPRVKSQKLEVEQRQRRRQNGAAKNGAGWRGQRPHPLRDPERRPPCAGLSDELSKGKAAWRQGEWQARAGVAGATWRARRPQKAPRRPAAAAACQAPGARIAERGGLDRLARHCPPRRGRSGEAGASMRPEAHPAGSGPEKRRAASAPAQCSAATSWTELPVRLTGGRGAERAWALVVAAWAARASSDRQDAGLGHARGQLHPQPAGLPAPAFRAQRLNPLSACGPTPTHYAPSAAARAASSADSPVSVVYRKPPATPPSRKTGARRECLVARRWARPFMVGGFGCAASCTGCTAAGCVPLGRPRSLSSPAHRPAGPRGATWAAARLPVPLARPSPTFPPRWPRLLTTRSPSYLSAASHRG